MKVLLAVTVVVLTFGAINITVILSHIRGSIQAELDQHALFVARSSAKAAEHPLLYDDFVGLQRIVDDLLELDSLVVYAFIEAATGKILAHSFERGVPDDLRSTAEFISDTTLQMRRIIPAMASGRSILDVAVPIIDRSVGVMRIGLHEDSVNASASILLRWLIIMISLFLLLGITGAFAFAHIITRPGKAISSVATEIARTQSGRYTFPRIAVNSRPLFLQRMHARWPDEMDVLIEDLNAMIERLETTLAQLQKTQASLLQSEKLASIGTLAAGIAHEINNPLAGLQNCVRRVQRFPAQSKKNEQYISLIAGAATQIEHVVQGLLSFTRKQHFELSEINVHSLLDNVIQFVSYRLRSLNIDVHLEVEDGLPAFRGSRNHLQQVVLNLMVNGIDAIQTRAASEENFHGELLFKACRSGEQVQISMRDNGVGIPQHCIDQVFDPFFTTKEVGKGTGLGLAVSYNIIKEHGGELWVESEEGRFTVFTLTIPFSMPGETK
ncbi:MAG: hypothetical protein KFH87_03565 [Bacteroidetes bacterium]|nr:hypothetical protein [Bacteroidota bacterium]